MMKELKKMIVSPHVDDDVLGCGGIMDKNTFVLYCGVDDFHIIGRNDRLKEADDVKDLLGHSYTLLENKVNSYILQDLITSFQEHINSHKPDVVYIPHPSYNQDHRAVYEAALVALRPHDINYFVKKVLVYEQPHVFLWDHNYGDFKPNYFIPIDIDRKIKAYKLMESQVREFRGTEKVKALALLRGGQSDCKYSEAYQIIRWVD